MTVGDNPLREAVIKANKLRAKDYSGMRFGKVLIVKNYDRDVNNNRRVLAVCDCGKEFIVLAKSLVSRRQVSCGCNKLEKSKTQKNSLIGKIFGKLQVINREPNKNNAIMYKCLCDCGNYSIVSHGNLNKKKHIMSCGDCCEYRNGKRVSFIQIKLYNQLGGILNFHSGRFFIDIALSRYGKKIAIEYDEMYWHEDTKDKDAKRVRELMNNKWNVITIRARDNIPSYQQISDAIEYVCKNKSGTVWYILDIQRGK